MTASSKQHSSPIAKGSAFLHDCREELDKVTRPTKQETIQATLVTLFIVIFVAGSLAIMDVLFNRLMAAVL